MGLVTPRVITWLSQMEFCVDTDVILKSRIKLRSKAGADQLCNPAQDTVSETVQDLKVPRIQRLGLAH